MKAAALPCLNIRGVDQSAHRFTNLQPRLRAMIEAKLKGEGIDMSEPVVPERTNLVDLMAALKKSLGQGAEEKKPAPTRNKAAAGAKVTPIKPPQAASPSGNGPEPSPLLPIGVVELCDRPPPDRRYSGPPHRRSSTQPRSHLDCGCGIEPQIKVEPMTGAWLR
jgi:hypothetical protein